VTTGSSWAGWFVGALVRSPLLATWALGPKLGQVRTAIQQRIDEPNGLVNGRWHVEDLWTAYEPQEAGASPIGINVSAVPVSRPAKVTSDRRPSLAWP
jgi:hypothetical protein